MLGKLQARLTYANVTATLALFIALGGGAYAAIDLVGRNDIKSKHIAPGAVKLSDTNDKLRLKCPTRTAYFEGACIERVARAGTETWSNAFLNCKDAGRRLPTPAELSTFRLEPRITLSGAEGEWTLQHSEDSATAVSIAESGTIASISAGSALPYRCVTRPKR